MEQTTEVTFPQNIQFTCGLQVVILPEAEMEIETRDELQFIVDACYKVWIKKSMKPYEDAQRKHGEMLYRRFLDRWGKNKVK